MATGSRWNVLLVALALGAALRVAFLLLPGTPLQTKAVAAIPDAVEYQALAENLARHQVFSRSEHAPFRPEVLRTPGFPLFLAPFYLVFSNPLLPVLLAQFLLSGLLIWLSYRLARELSLDERVSGIAALLVGVSPNLAFLSTKLVSETVFTIIFVVCVLLFVRLARLRRPVDAVACGLGCGLAALVRPISLGLPLVLAALLVLRRHDRRWVHAALLVASFCFVVAPWALRNRARTGRFVVSTATEHNIFLYSAATVLASEEGISLDSARNLMRREAVSEFGPIDTADEAGFWRSLAPIAWRHILQSPARAAAVQLLGFASTVLGPISPRPLVVHAGADPDDRPRVLQQTIALVSRGRLGEAAGLVWQARITRLGPFGIIAFASALVFHLGLVVFVLLVCLRHGPGARPSILWLFWPVLYFTLLAGPLGDARFRAPVEPLLAIIAAAGIGGLKAGKTPPGSPE